MINSKKMFSSLFSVLIGSLILTQSALAVPPKANLVPSDYATKTTYSQAVKMKKPIVVTFYVDWCHYCQKFMPTLAAFKQQYKNQYTFVMINNDLPASKKIADDFMISGYPSVYLVNPKNDNRVFLNQNIYSRPDVLKKEFDRFLRVNK